jgi:2'-5' RNA ligase
MKFFLLFLSLSSACQDPSPKSLSIPLEESSSFEVDKKVLNAAHLPNVAKDNLESNYLSMQIEFAPILSLKKQIEQSTGLVLTDRGEAHITVLTPPEVTILKTKLSFLQLLEAIDHKTLQNEVFEVICLGLGTFQKLRTYFVVVSSPGLLKRREKVALAFEKAGGAVGSFKPLEFFPHITTGFVGRDLHLQDGVIKDRRSCTASLKMRPS